MFWMIIPYITLHMLSYVFNNMSDNVENTNGISIIAYSGCVMIAAFLSQGWGKTFPFRRDNIRGWTQMSVLRLCQWSWIHMQIVFCGNLWLKPTALLEFLQIFITCPLQAHLWQSEMCTKVNRNCLVMGTCKRAMPFYLFLELTPWAF